MDNGNAPPEGQNISVPLSQILGNLLPGDPEVLYFSEGAWRTRDVMNEFRLNAGQGTPMGSIADRLLHNTMLVRVWTAAQRRTFWEGSQAVPHQGLV